MNPANHRRRLSIALVGGLAVLTLVWVAHLPSGTVGLAYLGPAALMFMLLSLGRYPGERLLIAFSLPTRRRAPPTFAASRGRGRVVRIARGGDLIASGLAGRAPPLEGFTTSSRLPGAAPLNRCLWREKSVRGGQPLFVH